MTLVVPDGWGAHEDLYSQLAQSQTYRFHDVLAQEAFWGPSAAQVQQLWPAVLLPGVVLAETTRQDGWAIGSCGTFWVMDPNNPDYGIWGLNCYTVPDMEAAQAGHDPMCVGFYQRIAKTVPPVVEAEQLRLSFQPGFGKSLVPKPSTPVTDPTDAVRLFRQVAYGGVHQDLPPGKINRLDALPVQGTVSDTWEQAAESVKLPPGWVLLTWSDFEFGGNVVPYRQDAPTVEEPFQSCWVLDPLQPLASRRFFHVQHNKSLREATAFNHIAGSIALGFIGASALAPIIGKAESDAGLLPGVVGGDDSANIVIENDKTGGVDEHKAGPCAVLYAMGDYRGDDAGDDFLRVEPGSEDLTSALKVASVGVTDGYQVTLYEGAGQTGASRTFTRSTPSIDARPIQSVTVGKVGAQASAPAPSADGPPPDALEAPPAPPAAPRPPLKSIVRAAAALPPPPAPPAAVATPPPPPAEETILGWYEGTTWRTTAVPTADADGVMGQLQSQAAGRQVFALRDGVWTPSQPAGGT